MSEFINIGLDFGTHQTKVCIEDSTDPRNITYRFLKFFEGTKDETYFLPSIVQINEDNTVTYGRLDYETVKRAHGEVKREPKPVLVLPEKPQKEKYPERPKEEKVLTFEEFKEKKDHEAREANSKKFQKKLSTQALKKMLLKLTNIDLELNQLRSEYGSYVKEAENRIRHQHKKNIEIWTREAEKVDRCNKERLSSWEKECKRLKEKHETDLKNWFKPLSLISKNIYRYFKIASFSKSYTWEREIDSIKVSIMYLAYVLFQIYKTVDKDSTVQMGIPQSISDTAHSRWQVNNADRIFYSAYRMYKYFDNEEEFLKAKLPDLLEIAGRDFTEPDYETEPGLLVLPEAFASLITLTKEGKISRGLTLLMDIGGGSTDISLFNVIEKRGEYVPNISHILSVHKGLNHLFRLYVEDNEDVTIEDARNVFQKNPDDFEDYIFAFRKELAKEIQDKIYFPLIEVAKRSGITITQIKDALYTRPVIYTGGGGVYDAFIDTMYVFTDPMSMSKDFVSLKNITNKDLTDEELSILSVSYGLSVPQMREPEMTPLAKLFEHIKMVSEGHNQYEHGISDVE